MNSFDAVSLTRTVRAAVVRNGIQRVFAGRLARAGCAAQKIVIASPWISPSGGRQGALVRIAETIGRYRIPTYVFTRRPDTALHHEAIEILTSCPSVELVYNPGLHAKVYACIAPYPSGFAIIGSANLTGHSEELYEIGLIVLAGGGGDQIVKQVAAFGLDYIRTRPDSRLVKKLSSWRYSDELRKGAA